MSKKPKLLSDFTPTITEGVLPSVVLSRTVKSPDCPKCHNVDCRYSLRGYKEKATIIVVETYAGSGMDMKCLCCNNEFKYCHSPGYFGNYPILNCTTIPLEYCKKVLEVEVEKFL